MSKTLSHRIQIILILTSVLASGCVLIRAKKDLAKLGQFVPIKGSVTCERATDKPICVALYEEIPGVTRKQLAAYQVIYQDGAFSFWREPGVYQV